MEDSVQFCRKTSKKTRKEITTTESLLKAITNDNCFKEIKAKIMKNEESSKKILRQCKFKDFNTLEINTLFRVILTVKKMMQEKIEQGNYLTQI